ncbi:hypothetical protein EIP86_001433 [Pleurotus ostreatoroseus]|nr:hypothetical protein EIP86_001433 [Pleurotus ostreatoroseus]
MTAIEGLPPPPYGKQPWYAIYLAYQFLTTLLLRLPAWIVYYGLPSNRPKSTWTLKRAVLLRFMRHFIHVASKVGPLGRLPNYLAIEDGPSVKATWIPPAPHLIVGKIGEWAATAGIECVKIPGYWYHKQGDERAPGAPARRGEKALLSLHGGAFAHGSAHPADVTSKIPVGILANTPTLTRALSVEYRLTCLPPIKPTHSFPAALIDVVAGYNYLVNDLGFDPANIVVEGDSAGANLALALTRYLIEHRTYPGMTMPAPPAALVLCSPWVDLCLPDYGTDSSIYTNQPIDYIDATTVQVQHIAATYAGTPAFATNRYISPASLSPNLETVSYKGFPRTFILCGGCEVFRDQIRAMKNKMMAGMGGDVAFLEMPDGVHDFLIFPWHEPERSEALQAMGLWLKPE